MKNNKIMTKEKLVIEAKKHVSKTAQFKNPRQSAHAIYFFVKQHKKYIKNTKSYIFIFKQIKVMLLNSFEWENIKIHKCFCMVNELMGYIIKKS